jgi:hypothetical protein
VRVASASVQAHLAIDLSGVERDEAGKLRLKGMTLDEVGALMAQLGEKPEKALQLWRWMYDRVRERVCVSVAWMTGGLRGAEFLQENHTTHSMYSVSQPLVAGAHDHGDGSGHGQALPHLPQRQVTRAAGQVSTHTHTQHVIHPSSSRLHTHTHTPGHPSTCHDVAPCIV